MGGYGRFGRQQGSGSRKDEAAPATSLASITTLGARDELVMDILRQGKALLARHAHVTTTIFVATLRQG
jgi:hypothetical protein